MHSPDLTQENIAKLAALFPNCVTEARGKDGKLKKAVDFDQLRQELSNHIVEGPQERYRLDWPGKREALLAANAPIAKTLRPCREESVDFDTTKNLFIEGDNLEALKLLQETYLGKVKMIYIDPPYNTRNNLIYMDDFAESNSEYLARSNQSDASGNKLISNTEANGRFHSDWLSMIYSRLKIAKSFLTNDGILFVSIDDNEGANLKRLCDEIFGEGNYKGTIVRATGQTTGQDSGGLGSSFDYVLIYSKDPDTELSGLPLAENDLERYEEEDERGKYALWQLRKTGSNDRREDRPNMFFPVIDPVGNNVYPIGPTGYESCWRFDSKGYAKLVSENFIVWKKRVKNGKEVWWPYVKTYLEGRTKRPSPLWDDLDGSKKASIDLRALMEGNVFDNPKPVSVIRRLIQILPATNKNDYLVMDFFAGSGTTAQAVMESNQADGGSRRFIIVQLPATCDSDTNAFRLGFKTISEITRKRMTRAGVKLKADSPLINRNLDVGFRAFKIDSSNMEPVYYSADSVKQESLLAHIDNIRPGRTSEDLLFQVLLDWGVDLALPIQRETLGGKEVFFVDETALAACFEGGIDEALVKLLAQRKPLRVVFRDSGFADDAAKINAGQIFKTLSPDTDVKVI